MWIAGLALVLLVSACHGAQQSVYNEPVPNLHDSQALARVENQLNDDDKEPWRAIERERTNIVIRSKTVGELIGRWKAQRRCLQVHAQGQEAAGNNAKARDHEIDAYNDCLEMEL